MALPTLAWQSSAPASPPADPRSFPPPDPIGLLDRFWDEAEREIDARQRAVTNDEPRDRLDPDRSRSTDQPVAVRFAFD
jgi:hypothetical protein